MQQAVLNSKSQVVIIRVPKDLKKKLDKLHLKTHKSMNKILIDMILEFVSREK